jgi:hypothetical protein
VSHIQIYIQVHTMDSKGHQPLVMASQKAKQKRTAKYKSTRTGRPKTPANQTRPRPIPTYRGAPELSGPGQPGSGGEPEREWDNNDVFYDEHAGLILNLPTIPEQDEGDAHHKPTESEIEEDEDEDGDDDEEFDSERDEPGTFITSQVDRSMLTMHSLLSRVRGPCGRGDRVGDPQLEDGLGRIPV